MTNLNKLFSSVIVFGVFLLLWTPLVFSRSLFFPYITGKAFFFRIIIEIIFVLWFILIWRDPASRPKKSWLLWSVVGLVGVSVLATIFSQNLYHSFWSNFERMDGLISYLHLLAYFLVISSLFRFEKIWDWFFHASLGLSLVMVVYSLLQIVGQIPVSQGRIDGTLGNAAYLAVYLIFNIFLAMYLLRKNWRLMWSRYLYGVLICLQLFVLYKTATRGAILGLLAGIAVMALILLVRKWSDKRIRTIGLGIIVCLVLLVAGFWSARQAGFIQQSPVLSRFADISLKDATTDSRLTIWQMSLRAFTEHPVLGWGPENYNLVFNKYYEAKLWPQEQWFDRSHNIFLDWLIDAGLLGLLAYLLLFVTALYYVWRSKQSELTKGLFTGLLTAYFVNNIFVFDNLTSYLLFFAILAYFHYQSQINSASTTVIKKSQSVEWDAGQTAISIVLVVLLAGSLYYFNFQPMGVASKIIHATSPIGSNEDPNRGLEVRLGLFQQIFDQNTFGSREAAEQVAALAANTFTDKRFTADVKEKLVKLAITQATAQIKLFPTDARAHLILGTLLANTDHVAEGVVALKRASELSPNKQTILFQLANAYLNAGDKQMALATVKHALELDENFPEARLIYALTLLYTGDPKASDEIIAGEPGLELDERFINLYVELKRYDRVLQLWQDKVKKNPGDIQGHFSLAAAYLQVGQRNEAIKELQTVGGMNESVKAQADYLISEIRAGRNPVTQ